MRDADNIRAVESLGVDWMGFIFYGPSSRNVETLPSYLPKDVKRVGVFVDEDPLTVSLRVKQFGLEIVQLHGGEDPRYIGRIRALCPGITVVKALSIASDKDLDKASAYFGMVEYFCLTPRPSLRAETGCSLTGAS